MTECILTNARVVTPDEAFIGTVRIIGGRIAEVATGTTGVPQAEDLEGDYLLPGLVDVHTDHLERHFVPRPGVHWHKVTAALAHDAQIAGAGITTVFDALALVGGRNVLDRRAILEPMIEGLGIAREQGMLRADHLLHLRCEVAEPAVLELLEPHLDNPMLRFLSVMDHTPGQRQFTRLEAWRDMYRKSYGYSDADLERLLRVQQEAQRTYAPRHRARIAEIARELEVPLASHDDETPQHVAEAAELGITVSEFPTTLAAAQAARASGMATLMGAPNLVRGGSHSGNVSAAELARAGLLDILSSDYVPVSMLHAAFLLAGPDFGYSLPKAIATVTANPARAARLDDRGRIVPGLSADLAQARLVGDVPVLRRAWRQGRRIV